MLDTVTVMVLNRGMEIVSATTAPEAPAPMWIKVRDQYGRTCHDLRNAAYRQVGTVVRMPKVYIDQYGADRSYLVNDWTSPDRSEAACITYHRTLAAAKAHLASVAL
jgi:hypothetical protein